MSQQHNQSIILLLHNSNFEVVALFFWKIKQCFLHNLNKTEILKLFETLLI